MLKPLLFLLTLVPFAASAQLDTVRQNEGDGRVYIKFLSEGTIIEEGYYQNGHLDGAWTTYHSNGEPNTIAVYSKGMRNGMFMKMTDEGRPEYIRHYNHDKLDGEQKTFNPNTSKPVETVNYSHGVKQGTYKKYHRNGNLMERGQYAKGVKTGKFEHYSENNKLLYEVEYTNDQLDAMVTYYFLDGDIKETGHFKNDKKSGFWKEYMHGGTREFEGNYTEGEKDGEWKEFFNGNLEKRVVYNKGRVVEK